MAKDNNKLWGIDLGGTKIEGVVIDSVNISEVLCRTRIATEASKGYKHILNRIKELIDLMSAEVKSSPSILGIGTPGNLDPQTRLLKNSNSTSLNGQPFKQDLEDVLGIEVKMANDANCFALAETKLGVVQDVNPDAEVVFGVIMGTGVGGGIVVNGKVINGHQGIAGEWGHNFLDATGGKCYCGKTGCVETVISGPALERYYEQISGTHVKLKDIVTRRDGDKHAVATQERLAHFFGLGISNIINILDPDVIVLGGGVGNIGILYTEGVKEAEKYTFNTGLKTPIVKPKLGDSAGVFGAALLVG
ncbi:ROK family protein [Fulvivirga ulvae]|uniref:ROK family protein n=1 Tax=Fulvivirga ulvae TaxID=2904245 RepID=UPI001F24D6B6|nr:ROK family protein [Fulvivirga ulvae]UII30804.1 ROK family protein [Fulvivirga ulvae]